MPLPRLAVLALMGLALATTAHAQNEPGRPGRPGAGQEGPGGRQIDPSRFVDRMMQMDANGDGKLSRDEIGESRFAALFDQADGDGDGLLASEEIMIFMENRNGRGQRGPQRGRRTERPDGRPSEAPTQEAEKPSGPSKEAFMEAMDRAGRALRGLRRTSFEADTFERDFMALLELESSLMDARRHTSAIAMSQAAREKFGTDQAAYQRSFQLHMAKALMATIQVEMAVLEGDSAKAKELVRGILENRNESHELFEQG